MGQYNLLEISLHTYLTVRIARPWSFSRLIHKPELSRLKEYPLYKPNIIKGVRRKIFSRYEAETAPERSTLILISQGLVMTHRGNFLTAYFLSSIKNDPRSENCHIWWKKKYCFKCDMGCLIFQTVRIFSFATHVALRNKILQTWTRHQ